MLDNIYVENFRRIEKAFIPFRDGITVITGNNGTGKSTIIEALLFNQYGKQKSGTSKDSIPRSGRGDDEIAYTSVDFTINGTHYRCRRYLTKKLSTVASLYSYDDDAYDKLMRQDDIRTLDKSLGTMIATSATGVTNAITQLNGLGYDGYKASLVATQKELDSLASLTQENRKKFFLDLLNYSRLDVAKPEISRQLRDEQKMYEGLERQSIDADSVDRDISRTRKDLDDVREHIDKGMGYIAKEQDKLDGLTMRYDAARKEHDELTRSISDNGEDQPKLSEIDGQIEALRESISRDNKLSEGYNAESSISDQLSDVRMRIEKGNTFARYEKERDRLDETHGSKKAQIASNDTRIKSLTEKLGTEPSLDASQTRLSDAQQQRAVARQNKAQLSASIASLRSLMDSVEAGNVAKCPTCGASIATATGKAHLAREIETDEKLLSKAETDCSEAEKSVLDAQHDIDGVKSLIRTWQQDSRDLTSLKSEQAMLANGLDDDERQLRDRNQFLTEHEGDRMSSSEMMRANDENSRLMEQQTKESQMKAAYYAVRENKQKLAGLETRRDETSKRVASQNKIIARKDAIDNRFQQVVSEKSELDDKISRARDRLGELQSRQGGDEASLKSLLQQKEQAKKQHDDMSSTLESIEVLNGAKDVIELMRATLPSKITPRLSEEASRLLEIASGGSYTMLEINDEYDVSVYADTDIRPMSQMSGGEQDMISLCIRIAIAEMTLETTSSQSQTMVLDEIFGALDDARKQEACDALRNLSKTLPRIVCITHVDEIKDMADWTFVVEKDENGVSHVREIDMGNTMRDSAAGSDAA